MLSYFSKSNGERPLFKRPFCRWFRLMIGHLSKGCSFPLSQSLLLVSSPFLRHTQYGCKTAVARDIFGIVFVLKAYTHQSKESSAKHVSHTGGKNTVWGCHQLYALPFEPVNKITQHIDRSENININESDREKTIPIQTPQIQNARLKISYRTTFLLDVSPQRTRHITLGARVHAEQFRQSAEGTDNTFKSFRVALREYKVVGRFKIKRLVHIPPCSWSCIHGFSNSTHRHCASQYAMYTLWKWPQSHG